MAWVGGGVPGAAPMEAPRAPGRALQRSAGGALTAPAACASAATRDSHDTQMSNNKQQNPPPKATRQTATAREGAKAVTSEEQRQKRHSAACHPLLLRLVRLRSSAVAAWIPLARQSSNSVREA